MKRILYVFHKSLTEPIPRLHGLSQVADLARHRPFTVLSFERAWRGRGARQRELYAEVRARLRSRGVRHLRLPLTEATWLEVLLGAATILFEVLMRGVRIVHCRSYIPALMGLLACSITPARLVFDMRGLFVDEYLFVGAFREGSARLAFARWLERTLLFRSDAIVVVSRRFRDHLVARPDLARKIRPERVHVIPNRVDLARFEGLHDERRRVRAERGWERSVVAVYAGSGRARWHQVDLMMELMARAMTAFADLKLLVMTYPSTEHAKLSASRAGVPSSRAEFLTVDVAEVPSLLAASDLSLMLIERHVSKEVCAPIKFGEYMASGLPVVAGGSIGDAADWVRDERLGLVVEPERIDDAARAAVEFVASDDFRSGAARSRCEAFAAREMDMKRSLEEYEAIYASLEGR